MFGIEHETLVAFSKSWGLFYLMGFFLCAVAYTLWPSNRKHFKRAKHSILDRNDRPWK
jgi:cytochrome c oxidase cbb3-type subunit 4